jgi:hypothetical protein
MRLRALLTTIRRTDRRWLMAAAGLALGALVTALALFGPIVRHFAHSKAVERGLKIEIGSVRPGFASARLRDVRVSLVEVPSIAVRLDDVQVGMSWSLGLSSIEAHGGVVAINGAVAQVSEQLHRWRAARPTRENGSRSSSSVRYEIDGIQVLWRIEPGREQHAWGVSYQRDAERQEMIGADLARLESTGLALQVDNLRCWLAPTDHGRRIERFSADQVSTSVLLDQLLKSDPAATTPAAIAPANQLARDEQVAFARARAASALAASRGPTMRAGLERVAWLGRNLLHPNAELNVSGVRLKLVHGRQALNIGPSRLSMRRVDGHVEVGLIPGTVGEAGRTPLTMQFRVPIERGQARFVVAGGPVSLASIGVQNGDFGLIDVGRTELSARGTLALSEDAKTMSVDGHGLLRHLSIQQPALSREPVRDVMLGFSARARAALDGSSLSVERATLELGKVAVSASGSLDLGDGYATAKLSMAVPRAACQEALDSVPRGLLPLLVGASMSGQFAFQTELELDTRRLNDMRVEWNFANECKINEIPEHLSPRRFGAPWGREVFAADGRTMYIESGPETADWVPYELISPHVETAVLVCEDGRYFRHQGFDHEAIKKSIRHNILKGRFARGASTITMQLAKNLYLAREKTLSRKLQEAFLTLLLEQELSKQELMELYLNVIEFAPGVYGIGPAARYYFNTDASKLSLAQALYLGSILPNPKRQHFNPDGTLKGAWASYLERLMHVARKIERISDAELEQGLKERIALGQPAAELLDDAAPQEGDLDPASSEIDPELAPWP